MDVTEKDPPPWSDGAPPHLDCLLIVPCGRSLRLESRVNLRFTSAAVMDDSEPVQSNGNFMVLTRNAFQDEMRRC